MKTYSFKQTQLVPSDIKTVWDFFATPANLSKITPTQMRFETLHATGGPTMYEGQLISYKVSPFAGWRLRWTTEITVVHEGKYFIDEQRFGPFALWHHQHSFEAHKGYTLMTDEVTWAVPFGFLGRMANALVVERQVKTIFAYRSAAIQKLFPENKI